MFPRAVLGFLYFDVAKGGMPAEFFFLRAGYPLSGRVLLKPSPPAVSPRLLMTPDPSGESLL